MGSPDWSKIPFEKMPRWKQEEIEGAARDKVAKIDEAKQLICEVCDKVCKSKAGLKSHMRTHKE